VKLYHSALPLGKDLVSTDLQPADDLAILAATALLTAYHLATQDPSTEATESYLLDTITLLEFASQKSRWAYPSRFLLVRLYRLLGAPSLSSQHYGMANLKSIQFDTLSHHILTRASTFSLGSVGDLSLVNECVESSQIYHVSGAEVSSMSLFAYVY
jgi:N-terminal acetyltransferase B complex non-catalytic subunit